MLYAAALAYEKTGELPPLSNLSKHVCSSLFISLTHHQKVYMFGSPVDTVVPHGTVLKLLEMYRHYNVTDITTEFDIGMV